MDSTDGKPVGGGVTLPPDGPDDIDVETVDGSDGDASLMADVEALIADAKTYFQAELSYQKSQIGRAHV